jgi:crossover junction endodeoxyribonuclease RusA
MITLSWPHPSLNPNSRAHWSVRAKHRATQRKEAWAMAQGVKAPPRPVVCITFHPPDNRDRDLDNALASIKGALDGIADATGVDDSKFRLVLEWGAVRAGGAVVINVEEGNEN